VQFFFVLLSVSDTLTPLIFTEMLVKNRQFIKFMQTDYNYDTAGADQGDFPTLVCKSSCQYFPLTGRRILHGKVFEALIFNQL